MPIYSVNCSCGETEVFTRVVVDGPWVSCDCGRPAKKRPATFAFTGEFHTASAEYYNDQLGMTFPSTAAFDRHIAERGLVLSSAEEGKAMKDEAHESANKWARAQGYADRDDQVAKLRDPNHVRDRVAANREAQAQAYADEHGSADRQAADSDYWESPLPAATAVQVAGA